MRRRIGLLAGGLLLAACVDELPTEPLVRPSLDIDPDSASESLELGVLPGGFASEGWGVNGSGSVVGVSLSAAGERAFIWTATGGMQDLGSLGGTNSSAVAINETGTVVGYADSASGASVAFRWTASDGMQPLGGVESKANDVNGAGVVVGTHTVGVDTHAFMWSDEGGFVDLGVIGDGYRAEALAINNAGVIVGLSSIGTGGIRAFRRLPGDTMTSLGTLAGHTTSRAYDVNDHGVIVGWSGINQPNARAFVWTESSGMQQLPSRAGTVRSEEALAITDDGDIVGFSTDGSFQTRAVLWTPNGDGTYTIHDVGPAGSKAFGVDEAGHIVGYTTDGGSTEAHRWTYPLFAPPPAPTSVSATIVTFAHVDVEWSAAGGAGFLVERQRRNNANTAWLAFERVDSLGADATQLADTAVEEGYRYRYRVSACNPYGCSGTIGGDVTLATVPAAPIGFSAAGHPDSVVLAWTDASDDERRFALQRQRWDPVTGWRSYQNIAGAPANSSGTTDASVVTGTRYRYRVRACNIAGCSLYVTLAVPVVADYPPAAPASAHLSSPAAGELLVEWGDVARETRYEIARRVRPPGRSWGPYRALASVAADTTSYRDGAVVAGSRYGYRVRACNYAGCSAWVATAAMLVQ